MKVIMCIDDNYGLSFNKRRVSKDINIIKDIESMNIDLYMNEYSYKMFKNYEYKNNIIVSDVLEGNYFNEFNTLEGLEDSIDKLIIYKFNRRYPSDIKLKIDLSKYVLEDICELVGNSHEKITREVYVR